MSAPHRLQELQTAKATTQRKDAQGAGNLVAAKREPQVLKVEPSPEVVGGIFDDPYMVLDDA